MFIYTAVNDAVTFPKVFNGQSEISLDEWVKRQY